MASEDVHVQQHQLVPKHSLLSQEEIEELLKRYNISKRQMPSMSLKDPALQELNAQVGDVVKVTRNSPTQGTSYFYRVVHE